MTHTAPTYRIIPASTADPGAGNNATIATPGLKKNVLDFLSFLLTTDVNAANRVTRLLLVQGGVTRVIATPQAIVPSSSAVYLLWNHGPGQVTTTANPNYQECLPSNVDLEAADTITITIENIQVGDTLTEIRHWWKVWY